jgi:hypothetical protein
MVLLRLNLFIVNINSSLFLAMLFHSDPLFADKSALYFTAIGNDNPTLPELPHESIDWCLLLLLIVLALYFLDVMNNVYEFPSFYKRLIDKGEWYTDCRRRQWMICDDVDSMQ